MFQHSYLGKSPNKCVFSWAESFSELLKMLVADCSRERKRCTVLTSMYKSTRPQDHEPAMESWKQSAVERTARDQCEELWDVVWCRASDWHTCPWAAVQTVLSSQWTAYIHTSNPSDLKASGNNLTGCRGLLLRSDCDCSILICWFGDSIYSWHKT